MDTVNLFEAELLYRINEAVAGPVLDKIMSFISFLGNSGWIFALLALALMLFPRTRRQGGILAVALLLDLLVVNLIAKPLFGRPRPFDVLDLIRPVIPLPEDYSFPSGHTAVAFAAAFAMRQSGKKAFTALFIFACIMGLTRLYLMVHYPSDVVFGALLGSLCGICAVWLWKKAEGYGRIKR